MVVDGLDGVSTSVVVRSTIRVDLCIFLLYLIQIDFGLDFQIVTFNHGYENSMGMSELGKFL